MKILKRLGLALFAGLLMFGSADAQKLQFPTKVRFIAGGYVNKAPYFSTLEAALNDVLPVASASDPYVFWVESDTIRIADWDSVFTSSGLTMKDSIDFHYVATGKIKWGGFGFGGGGSIGEGGFVPLQDTETEHYGYPNWDQTNTSFSLWLRQQGKALDSIDQHIFDLIVYLEENGCMSIVNDTLVIDYDCLGDSIGAASSPWPSNLDTTRFIVTDIARTMAALLTNSVGFTVSSNGYIQHGVNNSTSKPRVIWVTGSKFHASLTGSDDENLAFESWVEDTYVPLSHLTDPDYQGIASFTTTATTCTVTVAGLAAGDVVQVTPLGATYNVNDILFVTVESGQFIVTRNAGGTSGLSFNWSR